MKFFTLLYIALQFASCKGRHEANDSKNMTDLVQAKADVYAAQEKEAQDEFGFVGEKCDGLLFSSLFAVAGGDVDILQAKDDETRRWYRHAQHDCYPRESKSDISQDMLLGLLWWAWETGELGEVNALLNFGKANNWVMGDGDITRTIMRPSLIYTAYLVSLSLGGSEDATLEEPVNDDIELYEVEGFEAHLQVLHVLLRAHVMGFATDAMLEVLHLHAEREPTNALYQAAYHLFADGEQGSALLVLADDKLFPPDRLPAQADRCEEYLFQRDDDRGRVNSDWEPCDGDGIHSGTDLRFALKVIKNELRKGKN